MPEDNPVPSQNTKVKSIKVPSVQGSTFLTNTGAFFSTEKLSVPVILRHSVNPYYVQVKSRVTNQMFTEGPDYSILNPAGEKDEKVSAICKKMCENLIDYNTGLKTNLFLHGQAGFGDIFDFGPTIFEPVWTDMPINGITWKGLYALNRLPIDTFRLLPDSVDRTPSQIVKGICMVDGKIKYYQYQEDNKFHEVVNILHIKSPNSRDLAGDALSWPVIPLIEILNYLIDLRRIKNARIAVPSTYVKMLSDDDDTIAAATDIITNQGSKQNFAHDENIEVYTLDIGNNGTVEDAIASVEKLIDAMYNPAAMISNQGTRLGGSDQGAERLIYAQSNTFLSWLDLGFSTLIQRWLDINGFVGYTGQVWFPKLEVDRTVTDLQKANDGYTDGSLTRDERRVLRGFDVTDDETAALLDEEFKSVPAPVPELGVVQNSARKLPVRPNPALPIAEETVDKLNESERKFESSIYDALGINVGTVQNGGPGSGNFGHAGRPGEVGGSGGGGGGGSSKASSKDIDKAMSAWAKSKGYDPDANKSSVSLNSDRGHMDIPRTDAENAALGNYKGFGYQTMNSINYGTYKGGESMKKESEEHMKALDKVIDKSEIAGGKSYSGVGEKGSAMFKNVSPGDKVDLKGYISTTTDKKDAEFYTDGKKDKTVLVFNHKSGDKGFFMGNSNPEKELLLPRGQSYSVTKKETVGKVTYVHLDKVRS